MPARGSPRLLFSAVRPGYCPDDMIGPDIFHRDFTPTPFWWEAYRPSVGVSAVGGKPAAIHEIVNAAGSAELLDMIRPVPKAIGKHPAARSGEGTLAQAAS